MMPFHIAILNLQMPDPGLQLLGNIDLSVDWNELDREEAEIRIKP